MTTNTITKTKKKQTPPETKICGSCLGLSKRSERCECNGTMHSKTTPEGIELMAKKEAKKLANKKPPRRLINKHGEFTDAVSLRK
jgi:hypothetical protein